MARSIMEDQSLPPLPPKEAKNVERLIEIMKRSDSTTSSKPQMARVPPKLLRRETNKTCFDPLVVSLGPYHHGKERLKPMEPYKEDAARWFVRLLANSNSANPDLFSLALDSQVRVIYNKFMTKVTSSLSLKNLYVVPDETIDKLNDEDLTIMMFLDGCFILHFINLFMNNNTMDLYSNKTQLSQNIYSILRDIFLLENQIPYVVLKSLMSSMPNSDRMKQDIKRFIELMWLFDLSLNKSSSIFYNEPLHLLDMLRTKLIGGYTTPFKANIAGYSCSTLFYRSIMELKAAGIKLHQSYSGNLSEIKFNESLIYGHGYLSLSQMFVSELTTKSLLLNLAAYEICSAIPPDSPCIITSYICFLSTLFSSVDDVKELRSKGILVKRLVTNEEVVQIFNEATIDLFPHTLVLVDIKSAIHKHCKSKSKVRFAELLHTHFSSPWTIFSLVGAFCFFVLALLQTIFTIKR